VHLLGRSGAAEVTAGHLWRDPCHLQPSATRRRVRACRLSLHPLVYLRCFGLRASGSITVPGGFCAERTATVAATPRPVQALPTSNRLRAATNDDLLKLLEHVSRDVTRRVANYRSAETPAALLDGLKFAHRAERITHELYFGYGFSNFNSSLRYAEGNFAKLLAGSSFDDEEGADDV